MSPSFLYQDRECISDTCRPSIYAPSVLGKQGKILTTLYTSDGNGPHPVIIFAHGFPGHEKNIDLAQAMRRIGFHVLIFYYGGCWGSDGLYTFANSIDDTHTMLDFVLKDEEYNFDKDNIFFLGHSMGCFAAAKIITVRPEIKGCVFLMPCDLGYLYKLGEGEESLVHFLASELAEGAQCLNCTDPDKLLQEIAENTDYYSFEGMIGKLAEKNILWISGKHDEIAPEYLHTLPFMAKLHQYPQRKIVWRSLNTDHYFSDIRIQLSYEIANFLSSITAVPGGSRFEQASFSEEFSKLLREEYKTLTLSEAAAHFNISVPYLSKLIREKTGHSFISLLTREKMGKAKELLLDTQLSVGEIAECLGYNDATYFMKCFKKYYNYTPTAYRGVYKPQ